MNEAIASDITLLLKRWSDGDQSAFNQLVPMVYPQLEQMAQNHLRRQQPNNTLLSPALVNEAYLRLCRLTPIDWNGRNHFFAVSAQVMRRILVDRARARCAEKRGRGLAISLDEAVVGSLPAALDLLDVDTALRELEKIDKQQAQIVEFRFFAGLSVEETAQVLMISCSTVKRDWAVAQAWIRRRLSQSKPRVERAGRQA